MKNKFFFLPIALPFFVLLVFLPFLLLAIVTLVGFNAGSAVEKVLGMSILVATGVYMLMLFGSIVNIPVYEFKSKAETEPRYVSYMGMKYQLPVWQGHNSVVAVNAGGFLIPVVLSVYFAMSLQLYPLILTTIVVSLGVFASSRPVRSAGVIVPSLVPPLLAIAASFLALYLYSGGEFHDLARMSFASGTIGTILGTYLFNVRRISKAGVNILSIGGIGTFDGILLTGVLSTVIAVLLA